MPRLFRHIGGFADKSLKAISIADDGTCEEVRSEGMKPIGTVNHLKQYVPTFTLDELSNLVASGKWEEFKDEPATAVTTTQPVPIPEQSNA